MAITSSLDTSLTSPTIPGVAENPAGVLGKDDFLKLLLVELQHQDPTEPMDSAKILTQTSQLATLESAENTNGALEALAAQLGATQDFSVIASIGKIADLGSNAIALEEGAVSRFELYFPSDVREGNINVLDGSGNIIQTIDVGTNTTGTYEFEWNGSQADGTQAEEGIYYIEANYTDADDNARTSRVGAYPIESVRFDEGETMVKLGSQYVPFQNIKEVY